ncbi:MAG: DUF938 domain-containing protein [Thainema sp.]
MNRPADDLRQYAPATERNRDFILPILRDVLPTSGTVLEISSGTGEHAVYFAPALKPRQWLPSDPDPTARASIQAWQQACPSDNLHPPLMIDVREEQWAVEQTAANQSLAHLDLQQHPITAIVNINMIHISPWSACLGLMAGAGRILPPDGVLYLYGPYKQDGQHTAPSNAAFDQSLRSRNPEWGVRDLAAVVDAAATHQLQLQQTIPMPANNLSVIFQKM